jgi:hypothetical protein
LADGRGDAGIGVAAAQVELITAQRAFQPSLDLVPVAEVAGCAAVLHAHGNRELVSAGPTGEHCLGQGRPGRYAGRRTGHEKG